MSGRPTCAACCDRQVQHDQDVVCLPCLRLTRNRLRHLPGLVRQLEIALAKMSRFVEQNGGRAARAGLDWSVIGDRYLDSLDPAELGQLDVAYGRQAAHALRDIRTTLVPWTKLLHDEQHVPLPQDTLIGMAANLSVHLTKLAAHPIAHELVREIDLVVSNATATIDAPANRLRIHVGPCPEQAIDQGPTNEPCPGQVTAIIPNDDAVRPTMACDACGTTWYPEQWNRAGERILQRQRLAA